MNCPSCHTELIATDGSFLCPGCGYTQGPTPLTAPETKAPQKKHGLVFIVNAVALVVLVIEGSIDLALVAQPMLAWLLLFPPLGLLWLISYPLLIALPFAWPASLGAAWMLDRDGRSESGLSLKTILLINAWTVIAAALYALGAPRYDGVAAAVSADWAAVASSIAGIVPALAIGLCAVPIFWSFMTMVRAGRRQKFTAVALGLGVTATAISLIAVWLTTGPVLRAVDQREAQYQAATLERIEATQKREAAAAAAARQKLMNFTPYEFGANPGMAKAEVKYGPTSQAEKYGSVSLSINVDTTNIVETATQHPTPVFPGTAYCWAASSPPSGLAKSANCHKVLTTPGGIDAYSYQVASKQVFFVRDGVFFILYTPKPAAEVPGIIDGLTPTTWLEIDKYTR